MDYTTTNATRYTAALGDKQIRCDKSFAITLVLIKIFNIFCYEIRVACVGIFVVALAMVTRCCNRSGDGHMSISIIMPIGRQQSANLKIKQI